MSSGKHAQLKCWGKFFQRPLNKVTSHIMISVSSERAKISRFHIALVK